MKSLIVLLTLPCSPFFSVALAQTGHHRLKGHQVGEHHQSSGYGHYAPNDGFGYHESSKNGRPTNNGGSYDVDNIYNHDAYDQESSSFSLVVSNPTDVIPESTALATRISTSISTGTSALIDASLASKTSTTSTASASTGTSAAIATQSHPPTPGNLCSGHELILADVHCFDNFLIGCDAAFYAWNSGALDFRNINVPDKEACHNKCLEDPLCTGWTNWMDSVAGLRESGISVSSTCTLIFNPIELNPVEPFYFGMAFGLRGFCDFPNSGSTSTSAAMSVSTATGGGISASAVTLETLPTSATDLCPALGGHCLDSNYIQCDRILEDDAGMTIDAGQCVFQPGIKSERACHDACHLNNNCQGWIMDQEQELNDCCHLNTSVQLPDPLPPISGPSTSLAHYSYGLKRACPADVSSLCPAAESDCVDGFKVRCGRLIFNDVAPVPSGDLQPGVFEELACHQACAEDPGCTTWWGESDILFETYYCYHGSRPVVFKEEVPGTDDRYISSSYGIRNACD